MTKSRSSTKGATKSDSIRQILKRQPKASSKEIQVTLQQRGIEASDALINKVKYGRNSAKRHKQSRKTRAGGSGVSKAEAIRNTWDKLGAKARPRDVISMLARRGMTVSSAQVSTLRKSPRRRRRGSASPQSASISLNHLLAAKRLAQHLGGIDVARTALDNLAKLVE